MMAVSTRPSPSKSPRARCGDACGTYRVNRSDGFHRHSPAQRTAMDAATSATRGVRVWNNIDRWKRHGEGDVNEEVSQTERRSIQLSFGQKFRLSFVFIFMNL